MTPPARRSLWRDRSFWRRTGQASVMVWLGHAAVLASSVVLARSLSVSAFGAVVLATSVVTVLSSLLDLTFDEAVVYYGVRADETGSRRELKGLLRSSVLLDLGIGIGIWLIILAAATPIAEVASRGRLDPDLVRVASLIALANTLDGSTGAALFIVGKAQLRAITFGLAGVTRLGLVLVVARTGSEAAVLLAYAVALAVASSVQCVLAWRLAWRPLRDVAAQGGVRAWVRPLFRFGVHTSITTTIASAGAGIVPAIVARSAGVEEAAVLAVAMLPITAVLVGSTPLRLMLLPEQARMSATGADESLRRVLDQYVLAALALGVVGALAGWLLLPTLVPALYSDRYDVAVGPARVLLIGAVARLATVWSKNFPAAIGRPQLRTWMAGVELALVLLLLVFLARRGSAGAAWALSISYGAVAVIWWVVSHAMLRRGVRHRTAPPPLPADH
ncbi:MAG: lipopolysaccharide biosynthesis protein [Acidimicrobiia bacterium]